MNPVEMRFRIRCVVAVWAAIVVIFKVRRTCAASCAISATPLVNDVLLDLQQSTSCTLGSVKTVGSTNPITVKSINSLSYVQYVLVSDDGERHFKVPSSKSLLLENVELRKGSGTVGGGVLVEDSGYLKATNVTFSSNVAVEGGAIKISSNAVGVFQNCNFEGNEASSNNGGAIYIADGGRANLQDFLFANNEAYESGGAIYNKNGHLRLFKGTFSPTNKGKAFFEDQKGHDIFSIESRTFLVANVNFDSSAHRLLGHPHACNSTLCAVFDASKFQDTGVSCLDRGVMGVQCDLCVEGKFRAINSMHSHNCIRCSQGTYAASNGQSQCSRCEAGKFQQLTGQTKCKDCAVGTYGSNGLQCFAIQPGYYGSDCLRNSGEQNASGCATTTICPEGYMCPGSSHQRIICPTGTYQNDAGKDYCINVLPGYYSLNCSAQGDKRGCTAFENCPKQHFCAGGSSEPELCSAGTYSSSENANRCLPVPAGWFAKECVNPGSRTGCLSIERCARGEMCVGGSVLPVNCPAGQYQDQAGTSFCNVCPLGTYSDAVQSTECKVCPQGKSCGDISGTINPVSCTAGTFATEGSAVCEKCKPGTYSEQFIGSSLCIQCEKGHYQDAEGATSCKSCPEDTFSNAVGNSNKRQCLSCSMDFVEGSGTRGKENATSKLYCVCDDGRYPIFDSTAGSGVLKECRRCPDGSSCRMPIEYVNEKPPYEQSEEAIDRWLRPNVHYWLAPRSWNLHVDDRSRFCNPKNGNDTSYRGIRTRCNFTVTAAFNHEGNGNSEAVKEVHNKCINERYTGVLCNECSDAYGLQFGECIHCSERNVFIYVVTLCVGFVLSIFVMIVMDRYLAQHPKSMAKWQEFLRVIRICVDYMQINIALPVVIIAVEWPENTRIFLTYFSFLSFDFVEFTGLSCNGAYDNFDFRLLMTSGSILGVLLLWYMGNLGVLKHLDMKLRKLKPEPLKDHVRKVGKEIFKMVDKDGSWTVEENEFRSILRGMGHKKSRINEVLYQMKLSKLSKSEKGEGKTKEELENIIKTKNLHSLTQKQFTSHLLNDEDGVRVLSWWWGRQLKSKAFYVIMQLLLLAHTPVTLMIFQYFRCIEVAKNFYFLQSDYSIKCYEGTHLSFLPYVIFICLAIVLALPFTILYYLRKHKNELQSPHVMLRIGFLYYGYKAGSETWELHDLMRKSILCGVLLFLQNAPRIQLCTAVAVCLFYECILNYKQPFLHKSVFWLAQVSYFFTGIKYVLAIGLYADWFPSTFEKFGWLFICMDIILISFAFFTYAISLLRMPKTFKLNVKSKRKNTTKIAPKKANKAIYNNKGDISKDIMKELDNLYGPTSEYYLEALEIIKLTEVKDKSLDILMLKKKVEEFIKKLPNHETYESRVKEKVNLLLMKLIYL